VGNEGHGVNNKGYGRPEGWGELNQNILKIKFVPLAFANHLTAILADLILRTKNYGVH
jgi:hypothetical protein